MKRITFTKRRYATPTLPKLTQLQAAYKLARPGEKFDTLKRLQDAMIGAMLECRRSQRRIKRVSQ